MGDVIQIVFTEAMWKKKKIDSAFILAPVCHPVLLTSSIEMTVQKWQA